MAANTIPIFVKTPDLTSASINAANTARDGSGTLVTLFTAGADGSRVDYIVFTSAQPSVAASSARVVRVFITDTSGNNPRLRVEAAMTAVTASNTVVGATTTITFTNGLLLASGQQIKVSQSVYASASDQTDVFAHGGDY